MTLSMEEYISGGLAQHASESLQGKRALVTGATSGIGLATACLLAREGVSLRLVGRRQERLDELARLLPAAPQPHRTLACDLTRPESFDALRKSAFFDVDVLINNAGLAKGRETVAEARQPDWDEMLSTNINAAFRVVREVVPTMIERRSGHVISLCSIAGHQPYEGGSVYCATKFALRAFSDCLRLETCGHNIKVTLISPGLVETDFSRVRFHGDQSKADAVYKGVRALDAWDIARQILFALKEPAHVNIDELVSMPVAQGSATKVVRG